MRVDTTSLISGALVCGDRGLGVLGSKILSDTATGEYGAGYLYNDVDSGDEAKEFRGLIVTPPSAGTFFAYEDGSFSLIASDGSYTFVYQLYVDGVDLGTATASVTIGATVTAAIAATTEASVFAGSASVSPVTSMAAYTDSAAFSGSASVGPVALTAIYTDSAAFSGSASVSPVTSMAAYTDSVVFAGSASVGPVTSMAAYTDSAAFSGSASVVGSTYWPTPNQVRLGVVYGPASEYTGTYAGSTGPTASEIAAAVWAATQRTLTSAAAAAIDNTAVALAVRAELAAELALVDAAVSSRATVASIMEYTGP